MELKNVKNGVVPDRMMHFLWALVILSVLFCVLVLVNPNPTYRLLSNTFECSIALVCMICCLYAYRTWSERIIVLLAAFAFGGYALSNTFWYLYSNKFGMSDAFFSVSELGFLGVMLFFIVAFRIEFPEKTLRTSVRIALGGLFLILALIILGTTGIMPNTVLFMFRLFVIALFIGAASDHRVYRYPLLWLGICLYSFASILYGIRETIFFKLMEIAADTPHFVILQTVHDYLSIVGPLSFLSFLLIQLGIFAYLNSPDD